jgi:hypothetical protein
MMMPLLVWLRTVQRLHRCRIADDCYARDLRCNLFEQFQPIHAHAGFDGKKTRRLSSRSFEAFDQSHTDGIGGVHEHDRHPAAFTFDGARGYGAEVSNATNIEGVHSRGGCGERRPGEG